MVANAGMAAAGAVGSSLLSTAADAFNAWQNYSYSKKLMAKQFHYQTKAWEMQNEYNLPINQMQRLSDANLNPHLVYGNGGASVTASTPGSVSQGSFSGMKADPLADLAAYQQLENMYVDQYVKRAEVDNHTTVAMAQRDLLAAQTDAIKERNFQLGLENGIYRSFLEDRPLTSAEKVYAAINTGKFMADKGTQILGMGRNSILGTSLGLGY